jgi:hypothetical protein
MKCIRYELIDKFGGLKVSNAVRDIFVRNVNRKVQIMTRIGFNINKIVKEKGIKRVDLEIVWELK